jgi:hypothetical protein
MAGDPAFRWHHYEVGAPSFAPGAHLSRFSRRGTAGQVARTSVGTTMKWVAYPSRAFREGWVAG